MGKSRVLHSGRLESQPVSLLAITVGIGKLIFIDLIFLTYKKGTGPNLTEFKNK